jgi:hypothetical protein
VGSIAVLALAAVVWLAVAFARWRLRKICSKGLLPGSGSVLLCRPSAAIRKNAERDYEKGQTEPQRHKAVNSLRSRARTSALKREPKNAASHAALSRQAKSAARKCHAG